MITLYTKPMCPYCDGAKHLLKKYGVAFMEVNITTDPQAYAMLKEQGHKSVPQVYLGDKLLVEGGFTGLSKMQPVDLQRMIDEHASNDQAIPTQ